MIDNEQQIRLARPYAKAAFDYAMKHHQLDQWDTFLSKAALITNDKATISLLQNPKVQLEQVKSFYEDLLSDVLTQATQNFLNVLLEAGRLVVLPAISQLFKLLRDEEEQRLHVKVESAIPLDTAYKNQLSSALTKKFKRNVSLECKVDEALLGGLKITAGNTVIDASVKSQLNRMFDFITGIS